MEVEIVSTQVIVNISASEWPNCIGDGQTHWTWSAPEWGYVDDQECYMSREEAVVEGQRTVTYWLKDDFRSS